LNVIFKGFGLGKGKKLGENQGKIVQMFFRLQKVVLLQRVSLIRPAPIELPQDRNVARVNG